ncbi:hypothetical protein COCSUDRAFT_33568 [Coccomyxa subellipsoidea C-169]|uniref:Uncharacterized protein n=1 Tax=Coccomyxa subellipsoidea (strain C-169) TaxID=574566 RepID=I0YU04_COCSC|nr:hypothetical protein COCSUDRAFT_33568 [Coccomyxa subellipsoidea C-169]EIE21873.1 hypothetical protein COCSUDRAFT_33568 [Coccomyxa subellipsoidea C-169]|eukprot:XP_005646417.1 hypothetical protein COCSUDRAFT_33568 [Coccomyxa subellipsoidea C-169]
MTSIYCTDMECQAVLQHELTRAIGCLSFSWDGIKFTDLGSTAGRANPLSMNGGNPPDTAIFRSYLSKTTAKTLEMSDALCTLKKMQRYPP